jgi:hypothetical protein
MKNELIYSRQIGTKRILGTDHSIEVTVRRQGPREWLLSVVCNGVATEARTFRTKKEALASAEEWNLAVA